MKSMRIGRACRSTRTHFYLRDCIDFLADKIKFLSRVCGQCSECPDGLVRPLVWLAFILHLGFTLKLCLVLKTVIAR